MIGHVVPGGPIERSGLDHDRNHKIHAVGRSTMRTLETLFTVLVLLMLSSGTVLAQSAPMASGEPSSSAKVAVSRPSDVGA